MIKRRSTRARKQAINLGVFRAEVDAIQAARLAALRKQREEWERAERARIEALLEEQREAEYRKVGLSPKPVESKRRGDG